MPILTFDAHPVTSPIRQQLSDSLDLQPHVQDVAIALMLADLRDRFDPDQCPTWHDLGVIQQDRYLRKALIAIQSLSPGKSDVATWQAGRTARRLLVWLERELSHADTGLKARGRLFREFAAAICKAKDRYLAGETGQFYCDWCEREEPDHSETCRHSPHFDHHDDYSRIGQFFDPAAEA